MEKKTETVREAEEEEEEEDSDSRSMMISRSRRRTMARFGYPNKFRLVRRPAFHTISLGFLFRVQRKAKFDFCFLISRTNQQETLTVPLVRQRSLSVEPTTTTTTKTPLQIAFLGFLNLCSLSSQGFNDASMFWLRNYLALVTTVAVACCFLFFLVFAGAFTIHTKAKVVW